MGDVNDQDVQFMLKPWQKQLSSAGKFIDTLLYSLI